MTLYILVAAGVGAILGAILGHAKLGRPLLGACFGAGFGAALLYFLGPSPGTVMALQTPEQFHADVLSAENPVVVDFYADWCGPCKKLAPTIQSLAKEYEGRISFVKVNVDRARQLAARYGVQSIPTVILFVKGEPVGVWSGDQPISLYRQEFDAILARQ